MTALFGHSFYSTSKRFFHDTICRNSKYQNTRTTFLEVEDPDLELCLDHKWALNPRLWLRSTVLCLNEAKVPIPTFLLKRSPLKLLKSFIHVWIRLKTKTGITSLISSWTFLDDWRTFSSQVVTFLFSHTFSSVPLFFEAVPQSLKSTVCGYCGKTTEGLCCFCHWNLDVI